MTASRVNGAYANHTSESRIVTTFPASALAGQPIASVQLGELPQESSFICPTGCTLVYRVEDTLTKRGPYRRYPGSPVHPRIDCVHCAPQNDPRLCWDWVTLLADSNLAADYYFGFSSLALARRWFYDREWQEAASAFGFRVAVYAVPLDTLVGGKRALYHGAYQTIFHRPSARFVGAIELECLN